MTYIEFKPPPEDAISANAVCNFYRTHFKSFGYDFNIISHTEIHRCDLQLEWGETTLKYSFAKKNISDIEITRGVFEIIKMHNNAIKNRPQKAWPGLVTARLLLRR